MWYIPSDAITRECQTIASLTSSLWEIFFHCDGPDQFNRVRNEFCGFLSRYFGNEDGDFFFPSYNRIAFTTKCISEQELENLGGLDHDGDGSTVSSVLAGELDAYIDSLIPSKFQEIELIPGLIESSQLLIPNC